MPYFIILMDQLVSLHPEYMNLDYTYQPDSIKEPKPLNNLIALPETQGLKMDRVEPVSLESMTQRERATGSEKTIVSQPVSKSVRSRQQNLVDGGGKFIEPRNELNFVALASSGNELHLPQRPISFVSYDWITLILLIGVALFASVRTTWNKYMINLLQSTVNYSTALRMYQEKNSSHFYGAFQLDVLFYVVFPVFAFQVLNHFRIDLPYQNIYLYLFCLSFIVLFFMAKNTLYRFMGALIRKKGETGEYLFNAGNYKRVAGLVLLPLVAVIAFYPYGSESIPVIAGVVIVVLLYLLLVLRGFIILIKKQFSIFYLFLYFCTLELLPLVLLYKILVV